MILPCLTIPKYSLLWKWEAARKVTQKGQLCSTTPHNIGKDAESPRCCKVIFHYKEWSCMDNDNKKYSFCNWKIWHFNLGHLLKSTIIFIKFAFVFSSCNGVCITQKAHLSRWNTKEVFPNHAPKMSLQHKTVYRNIKKKHKISTLRLWNQDKTYTWGIHSQQTIKSYPVLLPKKLSNFSSSPIPLLWSTRWSKLGGTITLASQLVSLDQLLILFNLHSHPPRLP